jgi:hypothetical protein
LLLGILILIKSELLSLNENCAKFSWVRLYALLLDLRISESNSTAPDKDRNGSIPKISFSSSSPPEFIFARWESQWPLP